MFVIEKSPVQQETAEAAAKIQDAANIAGVVNDFNKQLQKLVPIHSSDELKNHPVVLAFVSKLKSLTRLTGSFSQRESEAFRSLIDLRHGRDAKIES